MLFKCFRKRLTKAEDGEDNVAFEIDQLKNLEDKSDIHDITEILLKVV